MAFTFVEWLAKRDIREDFASKSGGKKNTWITIGADGIENDPVLAQQLFQLIDDAYSSIGGHVEFRSPQDIVNAFKNQDISVIKAIDIDEDPDPDALNVYKNKAGGLKTVASAAKTKSDQAKSALTTGKKAELNLPGYYGEVSDKIAKVLLDIGVPVVEDEATVRKVLQKDIIWYGENPQLSSLPERVQQTFGKYKGWYGRQLRDGKTHVKIMVGKPIVPQQKQDLATPVNKEIIH